MHTFQPYPMDLLEWNPMEKISKENFAVVTERDGKANAMRAGWGGIGHIWGKNAVFIFIRESRYTREILDDTDTFSICFFDPDDKDTKGTLKILGALSGRDEDKIAACRLGINYDHDVAYIDQSNLTIICSKMAKVPIDPDSITGEGIHDEWYKEGNYHYMYVGEILEILAR